MVVQDKAEIGSSTRDRYKITLYLNAGKNPDLTAGEELHSEFANVRDDGADAFIRRWGPLFTHAKLFDQMAVGWRDVVRAAWRGDEKALASIQKWVNSQMFTSLQFTEGRLECAPRDLMGSIFILFLRDHLSGKTTICENPDCISPYFVKRRPRQRFCSDECSSYGQRNAANKWWREHGTQWRERRKRKAKPNRRKP
jgi:hypothetical protein